MAAQRKIDLDRGGRIKYVRRKVMDIKSQERFAEVLAHHTGRPITRGAVGNWELGKEIGLDNLKAISKLSGVSLDWLAYNEGDPGTAIPPASMQHQSGVPLVGYVRAGAAAFYYANSQGPLDWVDRPKDATEETVAVQIQGDSLGSLFDQWLIYYDDVRSPVTPDLLGRLCVVGLMDDRVMVKKIRRSRTQGLYDLVSNDGHDPITDVEITWAARVKHMAPR